MGCHRLKIYRVVFLVIRLWFTLSTLMLFAACARTLINIEKPVESEPKAVSKTAPEDTRAVDSITAPIPTFEEPQLKMFVDPDTVCPAMDGRNVVFLSRRSTLKIVAKFDNDIPSTIRTEDLMVKIPVLNLSIPFKNKSSKTEFITGPIRFDNIEYDSKGKTEIVELIYRVGAREHRRIEFNEIILDTVPPPRPEDIRVTGTGHNGFTVSWDLWEAGANERLECVIEKYEFGYWNPVWRGSAIAPATVKEAPSGRFRIIVWDCALNSSEAEFSPHEMDGFINEYKRQFSLDKNYVPFFDFDGDKKILKIALQGRRRKHPMYLRIENVYPDTENIEIAIPRSKYFDQLEWQDDLNGYATKIPVYMNPTLKGRAFIVIGSYDNLSIRDSAISLGFIERPLSPKDYRREFPNSGNWEVYDVIDGQ